MLMRFLWRVLGNGLGLWLAARLMEDIDYGGDLWVVAIAAVIFSLVNMLVKPIVVLLSLPAIILSVGLFMLFINSLMLYLVTAIYPQFAISSFGAALVTVVIVWLANYSLSLVSDKGK